MVVSFQGNDSVVGCDSLNGTVVVQSSYNQQGTKQNSMLDTVSFQRKVFYMLFFFLQYFHKISSFIG